MERWQQIESLFQEALEHDPAQRNAWLREACQGDSDLRREVASLLANHQTATDFQPWAAAAAAELMDGPASLVPGQCLGPYRIECFLAAGGMGEVYRATDTRLHREVAIKVSAARFSERFEREARVIASLNHPNICQLHDVGPNYLVMELVEGPTLADRIKRGALPLDEALAIARQIAEGLEAAHEKGRVHRDLKPANVKITPEGLVKLLDFGLAKTAEEPAAAVDPSDSPTQTISATRAGVILGTAAYMSPEQARGAPLDKRADIWAFGCVLYEMLTGRQAFQGETISDILAAVLKEEPDWSAIPPKAQPLLRRCLVKDPKQRLRDIGDAMPLLEAAPEQAPAQRPWPWLVAAVLAVGFCVAAMGWWRATRPAPLRSLVRSSVELSPDTTVPRSSGGRLALSPDGTRIAVVEQIAAFKFRLATRRLGQSELAPLSGTEGAKMPFFSPNGQWIGFFADGKLKKVAVEGGFPVTLCDAPNAMGASWGDDDNIIAALNGGSMAPQNGGSGLSRISSSGGAPVPVTELNREKGETAHIYPQVLPGSRAVLFISSLGNIDVLSFKTGERKTLQGGGVSFGRYLSSGYLVVGRTVDAGDLNTLFAAPFDLSRLALTGAAQPVLQDVSFTSGSPHWNIDFSQNGTVAYVSGKGLSSDRTIYWLDGTGKTQPLHLIPGSYFVPRFSPDGKRLAFQRQTRPGRGDVWVKDLERETTWRLTSLPGQNGWPLWAPDGKSIVFAASNPAAPGMYWIGADGAGEPQRLTDKKWQIPMSFSLGGKWLAYEQQSAEGHWEIWTAPIEGDRDRGDSRVRLGRAEPFQRTAFDEGEPAFSPDGRWLAYQSNETGTYEVYVRPFPGPGSKWAISTGGGQFPIWSRGAPGAR